MNRCREQGASGEGGYDCRNHALVPMRVTSGGGGVKGDPVEPDLDHVTRLDLDGCRVRVFLTATDVARDFFVTNFHDTCFNSTNRNYANTSDVINILYRQS